MKVGQLSEIIIGDCLDVLAGMPGASIDCVVTSPPYWGLRNYDVVARHWSEIEYIPMIGLPSVRIPAEIVCVGQESSALAFVGHLVAVFREVARVMKPTGTAWVNLGDTYAAEARDRRIEHVTATSSLTGGYSSQIACLKQPGTAGEIPRKNLCGIPWRVALALQADGWILRSDIIWSKTNPMPESVTDRPTKAHEYVLMFSRQQKYYYDHEAGATPASTTRLAASNFAVVKKETTRRVQQFREDRPATLPQKMKNRRDVWSISSEAYPGAHYAVMPSALAEICIQCGCPQDGIVLDPFAGAGTTLYSAEQLQRHSIGIDLNPESEEQIRIRMTAGKRSFMTTRSGTLL